MSRPRSDEKRSAILEAARRVVAERGIEDAPTSAISRAAGVAEGTLFTYFKTKDDLMEALYLDLRHDYSVSVVDIPNNREPRTRLRYLWDKFLDMGIRQPDRIVALTKLRARGKLHKENEPMDFAVTEAVKAVKEVVQNTYLERVPAEYLVLLLRAHAEAAVEFIVEHPEKEECCRDIGFLMLWGALTSKSI
jgi:AcrR family transcriptional regulator